VRLTSQSSGFKKLDEILFNMSPEVSDMVEEADLDINRDKLVEELARPFVKLVLALLVLQVLGFVVGLLPGFDNTIASTSVSISGLVGGIFTVIAVYLIANFGRELEPRLKDVMSVGEELAETATLIKHIIYLIAVSIAYDGLGGVIIPLMGNSWMYELAFLVIALVPTSLIILDLYNNFEDITDLATEKLTDILTGGSDSEREKDDQEEKGGESEEN